MPPQAACACGAFIKWAKRFAEGALCLVYSQHDTSTVMALAWRVRAITELLDGGSLYWVFKGVILARQELRALEEIEGADGIRRCALVLSPDIIRTEGAARRPFQGWRYLPAEDAPRDLPAARHHDDVLPEEMARALAELGLR